MEGLTCYTVSVPVFTYDSLQHSIVEVYLQGSSHTVSLQLFNVTVSQSVPPVHTDSVYPQLVHTLTPC